MSISYEQLNLLFKIFPYFPFTVCRISSNVLSLWFLQLTDNLYFLSLSAVYLRISHCVDEYKCLVLLIYLFIFYFIEFSFELYSFPSAYCGYIFIFLAITLHFVNVNDLHFPSFLTWAFKVTNHFLSSSASHKFWHVLLLLFLQFEMFFNVPLIPLRSWKY